MSLRVCFQLDIWFVLEAILFRMDEVGMQTIVGIDWFPLKISRSTSECNYQSRSAMCPYCVL